MNSVYKKLPAVFLSVIMLFSLCVPALALGSDQIWVDNEDGTNTIVGAYESAVSNGVLELFHVHDFFSDEIFTAIDSDAFAYDVYNPDAEYLAGVTEIIIDDGIVDIGSDAFSNLPALQKVVFKGNVKISSYAFRNCRALETVVFEKDASLEDFAFAGCENLADIVISEDTEFSGGIAAIKDTAFFKYFDVDFLTIGSTLVYYTGSDSEVTIPLNVTKIGSGAFKNNTNIKKVNITMYVNSIADEAFMGCTNLSDVNFSMYGEINSVGRDVFTGTAYYKNYDGDFFTVGNYLIKYLGNDSYVSIPNTVTSIAPECFEGCYTTSVNEGYTYVVSSILVPASVEKVGENSFGLVKLADGSYYTPKIFAYTGTSAVKALEDAGYTFAISPAPADVDNDGKITAADARLALRMAVRLDDASAPQTFFAAEVNGDGEVKSDDARTILRLAVNLEEYTAKDLFKMPRTKFEILSAYKTALKKAARTSAGYTKAINNKATKADMNIQGDLYLKKTLSEEGYTNSLETYAVDSLEAYNNLPVCTLNSTALIKSAACILDNGKYVITIKFNDVPDNNGNSDIHKVFSAVKRSFYVSKFDNKYWWNGNEKLNRITKFDLTYTNPTVELSIEKNTGRLTDCKLTLGYRFDIAGHINTLSVASGNNKGNAVFERLDIVKLSDFVYAPTYDEIVE